MNIFCHGTHTQLTNLYGRAGADTIKLEDASGMTNTYGGEDDDRITVDTLVSLATAVTGDTVNLDGQAGSYLVNVLDTGTNGNDTLTVNGTAGADNFRLRALPALSLTSG